MAPLSLLRLEPEGQLLFARSGPGEPARRSLRIRNTSEGNAAWKVRTTAPHAFLVAPRSGVLKPGESAEAVITLLPVAGGFDFRFEVQAAAVGHERDRVERADWADFPQSAVEASQLRAVLTGGSTCGGASAGAVDSSGIDEGGRALPSQRPRRAFGGGAADAAASEDSRPGLGGAAGPGAAIAGGRAAARDGEVLRRSTATAVRRGDSTDGAAAAVAPPASPTAASSAAPLAPMGPVTKAVLGLLIAILAFNLYLQPLLGAAFGGDSGGALEAEGAPPKLSLPA